MARRLALLAQVGVDNSPWIRATGRESAAEVKGLGEEESLRLVAEVAGGGTCVIPLANGRCEIPLAPSPPWMKYRVEKVKGGDCATTVEVQFG